MGANGIGRTNWRADDGVPAAGKSQVGKVQAPVSFRTVLQQTAARYGVDPALATAVAKVESGISPQVTSPAGAVGIMQLMPNTARGLGVNPYDPLQNIEGGVRQLAGLLSQYHDVPTALAAYNAGAGNVAKYGGIPPFPETQNYVRKVMAEMSRLGQTASGGLTSGAAETSSSDPQRLEMAATAALGEYPGDQKVTAALLDALQRILMNSAVSMLMGSDNSADGGSGDDGGASLLTGLFGETK